MDLTKTGRIFLVLGMLIIDTAFVHEWLPCVLCRLWHVSFGGRRRTASFPAPPATLLNPFCTKVKIHLLPYNNDGGGHGVHGVQ